MPHLVEYYQQFPRGNQFLISPKTFDEIATRTISLLTTEKTCKIIDVSREMMAKVLKSLQIGPKIFAKRLNTRHSAGRLHFDNGDCLSPDRIHEHLEDESDIIWGAHGPH